MNSKKLLGLLVITLLILGSIWYLESGKVRPSGILTIGNDSIPVETGVRNTLEAQGQPSTATLSATTTTTPTPASQLATSDRIKSKTGKYERVKEITTPDGFINVSSGFKLADIVGKKVTLIDFWTYSCINCQRTTPYLNAWYEKYSAKGGSASGGKDQGLEIVGMHTPEFDFEKNYDNVARAVKDEGIKYPVVLDNDYSTWYAYKNRFWPRKYLIDIDGFIIYDHIGEGAYDETEKKIQEALKERSLVLGLGTKIDSGAVVVKPVEIAAMSPETYFGSARNTSLGNGVSGVTGAQSFTEPTTISPNKLYLAGTWNVTPEYAEVSNAPSKIIFQYQAKGVYFVAGSTGGLIEVEVLRDGGPLSSSVAGKDIIFRNGKSYVQIKENRLYRLIDDESSESHRLEMIIGNSGLQAYTFTFG
ncbi:MAG: thioredoxin-like domain-containing protein [Patescibacteria group bacterium]